MQLSTGVWAGLDVLASAPIGVQAAGLVPLVTARRVAGDPEGEFVADFDDQAGRCFLLHTVCGRRLAAAWIRDKGMPERFAGVALRHARACRPAGGGPSCDERSA